MSNKVNPIIVEIIRNALISVAQEMNASLFRSAYSPVIYEMKDCSVGIFTKDAELMGQSAGLPIFLGNLGSCIEYVTEQIGIDAYKPGDVFILNDSYIQGAHLSDITILAPMFYHDELVGFTATRAAMADVGNKNAMGSNDCTEIYQEGVRIPPIRLVDGGIFREDLLDLLALNSRFHETYRGDIKAQIAACITGEKRYQEILDKFGVNVVNEAVKEIFQQAERLDRRAVAEIPDGIYTAEGCLDNDGVIDSPVPVRVKVVIKGDEMMIDLTGSSQRRKGSTNCGASQTISACRVAFKELINSESNVNGGNFRNLKVVLPQNSIFAAEEPTACSWYFSALGLLIDLVMKALSPVLPQKVAAAHFGDSMVVTLTGYYPGTEKLYGDCEALVGGWGAFDGDDGESCLINVVNGDFKNMPIELVEHKYPYLINKYEIREDSEGAGQYRGGFGVRREWVTLADESYIRMWFERSKTPAWGLFGGQSGAYGILTLNPETDIEQKYHKINRMQLPKGTVIRAETGGGGGYGDPCKRDRALVRRDVENGYISPKRAKEVYGYTEDSIKLPDSQRETGPLVHGTHVLP